MKATDQQIVEAAESILAQERPYAADKLAVAVVVWLNQERVGELYEQPEWWEVVMAFVRTDRQLRVNPPLIS